MNRSLIRFALAGLVAATAATGCDPVWVMQRTSGEQIHVMTVEEVPAPNPDHVARLEVVEAARERGVRLRATGFEPGWLLELYAIGGEGLFVGDYGDFSVEFSTPAPRSGGEGIRIFEPVTDDGRPLTIIVREEPCVEPSGVELPYTVTIIYDNRTFEGCGEPLG